MTLPTDDVGPELSQPALAPLTKAAIFLVFTVDPGGEAAARDLLADLAGLQRSVSYRASEGGLTCVVGVGSVCWDRLFSGSRPRDLHQFVELVGAKHRAVTTAGDLLFHIRADRMDLCFELASQLTARLSGSAQVIEEIHGFKYFDDRDLLGFVDGTENPVGAAARVAVRIGAEDPEFAGGSYVTVQKYLHDMTAWNALAVEAQETVIGRTKLSNIELSDDVKAPNSHLALNVISDADGNQLQILRDNMPFGNLRDAEFGTCYIAYSRTPDVVERMLRNMFIGDPPGNYDRILDYSRAVTGGLFFVPSADFLDSLPEPPAA
jgi:putative iron-dependent peroxidase